MKGFDFGERVYKPYRGMMTGVEPSIIKDVLYLTTGEFMGKVVHTLKASDYEIIYQGQNGREDRVIRVRHFPDEVNEREEIIAVSEELTNQVLSGDLIIGLEPSKARTIKT
jgi:hypothetical protein